MPFPSPEDLPKPGIKPGPLALGVWSLSHWTAKEVPHFLMLNQLYIPGIKSYWLSCKIIILSIMKVKVKSLSRVRLFVTPWTVAYQAPPSMGSSRQEYWSGLPFPSPGDLPDPGIEPRSPALQADALTSEPPGKPTFLSQTECKHLAGK